jgi:diguanylate cyclase (GGDEF)-like protein
MVFALVVARSYRSALKSERDYSNRLHEEIELRLQTEDALRESHGRFEHMAHHDPLTSLPNRTLFLDRFEHALANARRYNTRMALLFIDLDQFKSINDTYGHETGDRILMAAADVLRRGVRASDTAARIAGDEFAVLIEHADPATVEGVVRRMSDEFGTRLNVEALDLTTSASIGISFFPEDGDDLETLLHRADTAMYRSKALKPGGWQYFSELVAELQVMKLAPDAEAD